MIELLIARFDSKLLNDSVRIHSHEEWPTQAPESGDLIELPKVRVKKNTPNVKTEPLRPMYSADSLSAERAR